MAGSPEEGGGHGSPSPLLLRPQPKRYWQITPMPSSPPTPRSPSVDVDAEKPPARSGSVLNLTASTLFGIYGGKQMDDASLPSTPWGTGAMTPAFPEARYSSISRQGSVSRRGPMPDRPALGSIDPAAYRSPPKFTMPLHLQRYQSPMQKLGNVGALSVLGLLFGLALARLHAYTHMIPVRTSMLEDHSVAQLTFWVLTAVGAGVILPGMDRWWWGVSASSGSRRGSIAGPIGGDRLDTLLSVIRCMGVYVGIAFAIRKIPCDATTQAALTLIMSNPIFWYLIDGSATGLLLATGTGVTGAAMLMGPAYEAAAAASQGSYWSTAAGKAANATSTFVGPFNVTVAPEVLALAAYTGTALFYCVVCMGNAGRALAAR